MRTPKPSWMTGPLLNPHPPEPNKLRPAVVVQDCELFDPAYPTVLVVPMTGDLALAIAEGMHWRATNN